MSLLRKNTRRIILIVLVALVSGSIGAFSGTVFYKRLLQANAAAFWLKGGESIKEKEYDFALLYFTQAVALKNDEPFFLESLARTYEAKQNLSMALWFYKLERAEYKRQKTGLIKSVEHRIELLEARIKAGDSK